MARQQVQLKAESMADAAYRAIRQKILDNVWAPGYQALEQALALELGMSRTPVREAGIRLANEGLVEVVPRHGIRVLPVSPSDMREIYEILSSLESTAAELVAKARPSAAELEPLEKASRDMEKALKRDDLDAWAQADERFHRQLMQMCGNAKLAAIVFNFWDRSHRARMLTLRLRPRPENSTREHLAIVQAIRRGDATAAGARFRAHRERASRELIELLQRHRMNQV
ncbi:MAG: GntR family transcriptional regulator [Betaproteobacteria bacterium]